METAAENIIASLRGRPWEIARAVEREIGAIAPYAELGVALGVPTWSVHERVVSLIPFPRRCNLHFWDGDTLADIVPGRLQGTGAGSIRYVELTSLFDVDSSLTHLLREAFTLKLAELHERDRNGNRNAALSV